MAKLEFNRALHLYPPKESNWTPKTLTCSALTNEGIDAVWEMISLYFETVKTNGYFSEKRNQQNKFWLLQTIENTLKSEFFRSPKVKKAMETQLALLSNNKTTPFEAALVILSMR